MKKNLANQICKLWNEQHAGSYEPTKTQAVVCKNVMGDYCVEVHPFGEKNYGNAFHSHNEVSDIERAFGVSSYITQDVEHKLYARIY